MAGRERKKEEEKVRGEREGKRKNENLKKKNSSPASSAAPLLVLPARRLPEVRHGAELGHNRPPVVEPALQGAHGLGGVVLVDKLSIDRSRQMIRDIVAHVQGLELAKLG